MNPLWMHLLPTSDIPNVNFVLIFVFAVIILTLVLRRGFVLNMTNSESCVRFESKPAAPQAVQVLQNPFSIRIDEESLQTATLKDGISLELNSIKSFWLFSYWNVDINTFHATIRLNWPAMRLALFDNSFLDGQFAERNEPQLIKAFGSAHKVAVKASQLVPSVGFEQGLRTAYPLILILIRNEDDEDCEINDTDPVSLFSVVHIQDEVCPMATNIISQFLKLKNGNLLNLACLYTAQFGSIENSLECVICAENRISIALLPCRHTCICEACYNKIDKCPVCRAYIKSFFHLASNPSKENESLSDSKSSSPDVDNNSQLSGAFSKFYSKLSSLMRRS